MVESYIPIDSEPRRHHHNKTDYDSPTDYAINSTNNYIPLENEPTRHHHNKTSHIYENYREISNR